MKARLVFIVALFFLSVSANTSAVPLQALDSSTPQLVIDSGGHTATVTAMAFTKDDKYLVTVGRDKVVRVWDLEKGETVRTIRGEIGTGQWGIIHAAALSPDNRFLAVGGQLASDSDLAGIGKVRLHEFSDQKSNGEVRAEFRGISNVVTALSISPKNKYVAAGGASGDVCVWSLSPPALVKCSQMHQGMVTALGFSPNERQLVSSSWDKTIKTSGIPDLNAIGVMRDHTDMIVSIAVPSDEGSIVSSSYDGSVRLVDPRRGTQDRVVLQGRRGLIGNLSVDAKGKRVLLCSYNNFSVCEILSLPAANLIARFGKNTAPITATALSHNGKLAATAGGLDNEIYVWSTETGEEKKRLAGKGAMITAVGFAKDGQSIAFASRWLSTTANTDQLQQKLVFTPDGLYLHNTVEEGQDKYLRELHEVDGTQLRLQPDGRVLEIVRNGTVGATIRRQDGAGSFHTAYSLTPNGRFIVSGGLGGFLALYDLQGNELRKYLGHTGDITALAPAPDGKRMVSGSRDQLIKLWNLEDPTDNLLGTVFVTSTQEWVAWEPGGYYVSSIRGDNYAGWQMNDGSKAAELFPFSLYSARYYQPELVAKRFTGPPAGVPPPPPPPRDVLPSLPPSVEIEARFESDDRLRVVAKATSHRGDILDIRIIVGGTQVPSLSIPTTDLLKKTREAVIRRADFPDLGIVVEGGKLTIGAVAHTADASNASEEVVLNAIDTTKSPRKLFVLAIGVSKYMDSRFDLQYPALDARKLVDFFNTQRGTALYEDVIVELLTDSSATRSEINEKLRWLAETPTAKDSRILFLSGHGVMERGNYFFGAHGYNQQQVPTNTSVSWSDISFWFKDAPGKTLLIIDTCHAGGALQGVGKKGLTAQQDLTNMIQKLEIDRSPSMVAIAASTSQEVVNDDSIFFQALMDGLGGDAAEAPSPIIDVVKLTAFVSRRVGDARMAQHVVVSGDENESVQSGRFPVAIKR